MNPRPDRVDGNALNARDLLAAISLDFEENEGDALGLGQLGHETREHLTALLFSQVGVGPGRRTGNRVFDGRFGEKQAKPSKSPEIADSMTGDLEEPSREVLPVELGQPPMNDEKDVLKQVLPLGLGSAQRSNPAAYFAEKAAIHVVEVRRFARNRRIRAFPILGRGGPVCSRNGPPAETLARRARLHTGNVDR